MKSPILLCALLTAALATAADAADSGKLAVIQFEVTIDGQIQSAVAKQLTDRLTRRIIQTGRVTVVDDLDVAREMQRLEQELKTGNPESVAPKLGKSLGADQILIPRMVVFGKRVTATAKLIDVGKSRTVNVYESEKTGDAEVMYDLLDEIVREMKADPLLGAGGDAAIVIPEKVEALLTRAESAIRYERISDALSAVEDARNATPDNPAVLTRCVMIFLTLGKPEQALEAVGVWQKRVGSSHPDYRRMVEREYQIKSQIDELKRISGDVLKLGGQFASALDRNDAAAANSCIEQLEKLSPRHPLLVDWRARASVVRTSRPHEPDPEKRRRNDELNATQDDKETAKALIGKWWASTEAEPPIVRSEASDRGDYVQRERTLSRMISFSPGGRCVVEERCRWEASIGGRDVGRSEFQNVYQGTWSYEQGTLVIDVACDPHDITLSFNDGHTATFRSNRATKVISTTIRTTNKHDTLVLYPGEASEPWWTFTRSR